MKLLCALAFALVLSACGGGGGGGSSSTPGNVTTSYLGFSGQSAWTSNGAGTVTSVGTFNQGTSGATYTETVNASNIIQSSAFTSSAGTSISFNVANGDTIANITSGSLNGLGIVSYNSDLANVMITARASQNGWSYQSYGVWMSGYNSSAGTVGAASVGTLTTGSAIPTSGTGNFTGNFGGMYVTSAGTHYFAAADMTANVNFATRSIAFATTNSGIGQYVNSTFTSKSGLNMTGTLTYSAATNQFSGATTTAGGGGVGVLTGTTTGKFYGPTATEIGGTLAVRNGLEALAGGFGGKR
jgi:hypothetical protein